MDATNPIANNIIPLRFIHYNFYRANALLLINAVLLDTCVAKSPFATQAAV